MKICTLCKEAKALEEFAIQKQKKDGHNTQCKACVRIYAKEYRLKNAEIIKEKEKLRRAKTLDAINEYQKEYRTINKAKSLAYAKEYRQKNKAVVAGKKQQYRNTEKGRLVIRNANNRRRAVMKTAPIPTYLLKSLVDKSKMCFYCNKPIDTLTAHLDHFIPLSKGGLHSLANLVVSCVKCNLTKHDKMPEIFYKQIGKNPILVYEEDFLDW